MSDGLDQPRLGVNEEPEEERREDVWEDADAEPRLVEAVAHEPSGSKRRSWWWSRCPSLSRFAAR